MEGKNLITITEVTEFTQEIADAVRSLALQLSGECKPLSDEEIQEILSSEATHLLLARENHTNDIVGMTTLITYRIPRKKKGWIEDVVVDEAHRRKGIGEALLKNGIDLAEKLGVQTLDLTSRPERESANLFYIRLGFEKRDTNVYRMKLN